MARRVQALAWDWTPEGALITVDVDGHSVQWLVPIAHVHLEFGRQLARVGCPLPPTVGAPSVGGFFSSISHAFKKASRAVKKVIPKAVKKATSAVANVAKKGASSLYRGAKGYAKDAWNVTKRLKDPRQAALFALSGGQSLLAQTKAQKHVLQAASHLPGPYGQAAQAALTGGNALGRFAQHKDPRLLQTALSLGSQAVSHYAPGVTDSLVSKLTPELKNTLMQVTRIRNQARNLTKGIPLPSSAQVNQARRVWHAVQRAEHAAQRVQHGRALPWDAHRVQHGQRTLHGLRQLVAQAQRGHRPALHAIHHFRRVGACL